MYHPLTDTDLLFAFYKGDDEGAAFEKIYHKYKGLIFLEAQKILKDNELAKDAVQEIFVKLLYKRLNGEPILSLDGFLLTATRRWALNALDHQKVRHTFSLYIQKYQIPEVTEIHEDILLTTDKLREQKLEQAISDLPTKMQKVFKLRTKNHLSYKAIAEETGTSVGTVKKQISTALNVLRSKLLSALFLI